MKRDLSTLDRDIEQALGRILQEAFAHGIDCQIISGGLLSDGTEQGIYTQSATQNYVLGSLMRLTDGREFVYAKAGSSNLDLARMHQSPAVIANYTEEVQTGYGWAAGQSEGTILITTGATPAVDAWKDGWLVINLGTGLGQLHRIKSNTSHATLPYVTLYDPIVTAFPATAEVSIVPNRFNQTIVVPTGGLSSIPVGVPLINVTAAYFYWSQRRGPAPLLVDTGDVIVIGDPVGHPATAAVAGTCGPCTTIKGRYGKVMFAAQPDEVAIVDLEINS